ncbi:ThiF family adenylyltransferase [Legionella pneumophila]|nr:ThiF family adenylyltransferase [Legionella pneumophila]MCK0181474.1 ThiF family adenylyltransferase [Legionella pneumophila]MCK1860837.1 ThiF family adenylyltransferase [Legionella pneumophila]
MNKSNLAMNKLTRYSQQIKMEEIGLDGQEKLKNSRVLCIGLGGLGSPLLLYLAAAGVGVLGIVDDDIIELSNCIGRFFIIIPILIKKRLLLQKSNFWLLIP